MSRFLLLLCLGLFLGVSSCSDDDSPNPCTSVSNDVQVLLDNNPIEDVLVSFRSTGTSAIYEGVPRVNECTLEVDYQLFNLLQIISFEVSNSNTLFIRVP